MVISESERASESQDTRRQSDTLTTTHGHPVAALLLMTDRRPLLMVISERASRRQSDTLTARPYIYKVRPRRPLLTDDRHDPRKRQIKEPQKRQKRRFYLLNNIKTANILLKRLNKRRIKRAYMENILYLCNAKAQQRQFETLKNKSYETEQQQQREPPQRREPEGRHQGRLLQRDRAR